MKNPMWARVASLSTTLFLVFLADAILSYWVPGFIQTAVKKPFLMGLIISFSSLVGLLVDLIFPQLLHGITVKKLIFWGGGFCLVFAGLLTGAVWAPWLTLLLTAMAVWGVYYELLGFAGQQFVADTVPLRWHASAWGVMGIFKSLAYFLGPLIAGWVILRGQVWAPVTAVAFGVLGLLSLMFSGKIHQRPMEIDIKQVNLWEEIKHWRALLTHVWPIVLMSLFMGLIDATFWTTGAVWSEHLSKISYWGGWFLPMYTLPTLFMGFAVAKWQIVSGKKKWAQITLLIAGMFLVGLALQTSVWWQLLMVFMSSLALTVVYPLTDGVYSDIVGRMGRNRRHMIGLSSSTVSLAYVVGPALAGAIAGWVGEQMTFVVAGAATVLVAAVLLAVTPAKLKVPQTEMKEWK